MKQIILLLAMLAAPTFAKAPFTSPLWTPNWNPVGIWDSTQPNWTDALSIKPDGTFSRASSPDSGHWFPANIQNHNALILEWDHWKPEVISLVDPDNLQEDYPDGTFLMHRRQPTIANAVNALEMAHKPSEHNEMTILAATFGAGSTFVDVTEETVKLLNSQTHFYARPEWFHIDPTPGTFKALIVSYSYLGEKRLFTCNEGEEVSIAILINNLKTVSHPATAELQTAAN